MRLAFFSFFCVKLGMSGYEFAIDFTVHYFDIHDSLFATQGVYTLFEIRFSLATA